jgi:hypothetical protein
VRRLVAIALCACSSGPPAPTAGRADVGASPAAPAAGAVVAIADVRPFPAAVRSLRLRRSVAVKLGPDATAKNLGTVAADTRVVATGAATGPGCATRWIAIEPRGWVCEDALEASELAPSGVELPKLGRGQRLPGAYGKVTRAASKLVTMRGGVVVGEAPLPDSTMVRREGDATIRGAPYWRIGKDEYVAAAAITPLEAPAWRGVRLGDETGRVGALGFAVARTHVLDRVPVWSGPDATSRVRTLAPRTLVALGARDAGGAWAIGEGEWLHPDDVRPIEPAAPPPGLAPGERWIDVDLDRQLLVAYDGATPAYATLVSSGKKKTPTQTGLYRVWVKFAETTMTGQMADEPSYRVATVPWTQFYAKDLALHTAYWHDRFGTPRSHGCVNLSPIDARFLYFWTEPSVPPGWSMAHGVVERPGTMIRVRSAADPTPAPRGYAARVAELVDRSSDPAGTVPP